MDRPVWDDFVRRSKNGTFLFERGFMEYHADRFTDASLMIYSGDSELIALLPANRRENLVQSHAGLGLGGLVVDGRMSAGRVLDVFEAIVIALRDDGVQTVEYKTIPYIYHRMPADEDRYALFLLGARLYRRDILAAVPRSNRAHWRKGHISDRNKATRLGLRAEESDAWQEFWPVLTAHLSAKHSAVPVHSVDEILLLRERFPEAIRLFVVRVDEGVAAGCVVFVTDQLAHVQYIASTATGRATGALDLLFFELIANRFRDLPFFDFGGCNLNDGHFLNRGLADFKEGFGARAVVHDFYRFDLDAVDLDALRADNRG